MSPAKFERMDRTEIIEKIGSFYFSFGQIFGQISDKQPKEKA